MSVPPFGFVFALCQPACQKWLKQEMAERHPELRFAYNRPGLVTFKAQAPLAVSFRCEAAFARHWGFSLGLARTALEVKALADALPFDHLVVQVCSPPLPEVSSEVPARNAAELEAELVEACGPNVEAREPRPGEWVLDVIVGHTRPEETAGLDDAAWLVGVHQHESGRSPHAGGPHAVPAPEASPSRAYSKIEEAIAWQSLPLLPGQRALELGAAPGGAVLALLERGLDVVALDPGALDPSVVARAFELGRALTHLEKPAGALVAADLQQPIDWLLVDMNLAPQVAVRAVERAVGLTRKSLRGAVITLKMNDARAVSAIGSLLQRLAALKLGQPRAMQLPSNRSEIAVVLAGARR